MNPQMSFAAYREHITQLNPPCVPFIAVYLSDLTFINEGNPDFIEGIEILLFTFVPDAKDALMIVQAM